MRSPSSLSLIAPSEPGTQGMPRRFAVRFALDLVAHQPDMLGFRADEGDLMFTWISRRKRTLSGEEAITRVQRIGAGDLTSRRTAPVC